MKFMLQFQSEMVLFASEICNLTTGSALNPKINYNNVNGGTEDYTKL